MDLSVMKSEIDALTKEIENAKVEEKVLTGRQKEILKVLEKEYNLKSIEELENKLKEIKTNLTTIESQITEKYTALKEQYSW